MTLAVDVVGDRHGGRAAAIVWRQLVMMKEEVEEQGMRLVKDAETAG